MNVKNEPRYQSTKTQLRVLLKDLKTAKREKGKIPERAYNAIVGGIQCLIDDMKKELKELENLQNAETLEILCIEDLPDVLIKARIARGMTQNELAKKLGLKRQQIKEYELTGYRAVGTKRFFDVMAALELSLKASIPLK